VSWTFFTGSRTGVAGVLLAVGTRLPEPEPPPEAAEPASPVLEPVEPLPDEPLPDEPPLVEPESDDPPLLDPPPLDPPPPPPPPPPAAGVTAVDAVDADDVPAPFVAVAVNVYEVPFVRPDTTQLVAGDVTVHVFVLSSTVVTVYVDGVPPLPADTVTVACPLPATAVGVPGVPGGPGITALEAVDDPDVPSLFVAVDVNVYEVPFVRPVTVQLVAGDVTVHVFVLSSTAVTVYDVGEPVPAVTVTTACELPATALGVPGVPGGGPAAGVTEPDALEYEPVPIALIAAILK
jgi:hypothetical protein